MVSSCSKERVEKRSTHSDGTGEVQETKESTEDDDSPNSSERSLSPGRDLSEKSPIRKSVISAGKKKEGKVSEGRDALSDSVEG